MRWCTVRTKNYSLGLSFSNLPPGKKGKQPLFIDCIFKKNLIIIFLALAQATKMAWEIMWT